MKKLLRAAGLFLLLTSLACPLLTAHAQGTAFTYQGRLNVGASVANGSYDLRFALYDALTSGIQQGNLLTNSATAVSNGLFTVTLDFGNQFPGAARWLEIAVRSNGVPTFTTLVPRQALNAAPYAITAGNVSGPINGANIANNSITSSQLSSNAAVANLNAAGQSGVASGGIVMAASDNPALVAAGYVKLGKVEIGDGWEEKHTGSNTPAPRNNHTAVWTGSEMIIWGGVWNNNPLNDGARYNPTTDVCTAISTNGDPSPRLYPTAVWTGSEMIIWGGSTNPVNASLSVVGDGARYNPVSNSWSPLATSGAPSPRYNHSAVWTGSEMIVWGGLSNSTYYANGARYNPTNNTWSPISPSSAPSVRAGHVAVWTGSEMLIWAGGSNTVEATDGGRYNPIANSWTATSTTGIPTGRYQPAAVWTGAEMIIWGGYDNTGSFPLQQNTGGRYNPFSNSWSSMITGGSPTARAGHSAVWTGKEMIIWGGGNSSYFNDGARYIPASDAWEPVTTNLAPSSRAYHSAFWTGTEMLVYGGQGSVVVTNINSYTLGKILNLYSRP